MPQSIYGQVKCGQCGTLVYADQARTITAGGTPLCDRCYYAMVFPPRKHHWYSSLTDETRLLGLNILELLLAVAIIGGALAATVPTVRGVFDRLERRELATYLAQAGSTEMAGLALETVEQGGGLALQRMVDGAVHYAGIPGEDIEEFAAEMGRYEEFGSIEEKAGFLVRTIDEWKARLDPGDIAP